MKRFLLIKCSYNDLKKGLEKYSICELIIEILPPTVQTYKIMNYQRFKQFGKQSFSQHEMAKQTKQLAKNNVENSKQVEQKEAFDNQCEDTMSKPVVIPKIKISFDEEQTKKIGWQKGISSLVNQNQRQKIGQKSAKILEAKAPQPEQQPLQIPYNKRVEQIMSKKPLRERLAGLLPGQLQLPISFDHQQLLKRMQLIDRTIQFLGHHRGVKVFFFDAIRKSIFETSTIVVQLKMIQQLTFLDDKCYQLQWGYNETKKRHEIKLIMPKVQSMDLRKSEMRKKIVNYLILKEGQFMAEKKLTKVDPFKWHDLFDIKKIEIPQKSLPIHPNQTDTDMRSFPDQEIEKIQNPALKALLKTKKVTSQVKSLSSASVADMIFSKVPANEISNKILSVIKQKQRINNQLKQQQQFQSQKIDKQAMLTIYDEILMVYMSKNVSNIFKVTLIQLLQQRLKIKNQIIADYVEKILKLDKMDFLKVVLSSKKLEVVQIDKVKYKESREIVNNSF